MRLRNVRGSQEMLESSEYVVQNPTEWKGRWRERFGNDNPIYIEVGMGKGQFITTLAGENPDINYIGIEKFSSVLVRGLEKQTQLKLPNLYFMREDAESLPNYFAKEEVTGIYLNFSDPWPKDRHAKRRLTSRQFFERYDQILEKNGEVQFKTDNRMLFDFSMEEAEAAGWRLAGMTYDLHHSDMVAGNVMTEYEKRVSARGNSICKMVVQRP